MCCFFSDTVFPGATVPPAPISIYFELAVSFSGSIGEPLREAHRKALEKLGTVSEPANIIAVYCELTGLGRNKSAYSRMKHAITQRLDATTDARLYDTLIRTRNDQLPGTCTMCFYFVLHVRFICYMYV